MFGTSATNFLSRERFEGLRVVKGQNNLSTCFQYKVKNSCEKHLLTVKIYDKMVDLVVRDGALTVGSRINNILGSKYTLSIFEKRLCQAQYTGMTRIEISICQAAIQDYGLPWAHFSRFFNQRMQAAMEYLVSTVLNHRQSLTLTYRRLPIYRLM